MMLLLDSEALSATAHGPAHRRLAVRSLMAVARRQEDPIGTAAAVLAEVIRGRPADAGIFAALRRERIVVVPVDEDVAVRAGRLLGAIGAGSEHAADAFLVAVADLTGGIAVIATSDVEDIERLASHCRSVEVASINAG